MTFKPDLMAEIDAVLDAQHDPQLDVMLTLVFGGYEHEPVLDDRGWTKSDRDGFRNSVHATDTCGPGKCGCRDGDLKDDLPLTAFRGDAHLKSRAYLKGLLGQEWVASLAHDIPIQRATSAAYHLGVMERIALIGCGTTL